MKFNGIMIAFVGGQIFNWFTGQKAQPEPLLRSLSQLKLSTTNHRQGRPKKKKKRESLSAAQSSRGSLLLTNDGHFAFSKRLGQWLAHIIFLILQEPTVPNKPFSSPPYQGDLLFSPDKTLLLSFLSFLGNLSSLMVEISATLRESKSDLSLTHWSAFIRSLGPTTCTD